MKYVPARKLAAAEITAGSIKEQRPPIVPGPLSSSVASTVAPSVEVKVITVSS